MKQRKQREDPEVGYDKTSIEGLRNEVLSLKIDSSALASVGKKLTPEEMTLLKVILLQEREKFTEKLLELSIKVTTALLKSFDQLFVKDLLNSACWNEMVAAYLQDKIQSQQQSGLTSSKRKRGQEVPAPDQSEKQTTLGKFSPR